MKINLFKKENSFKKKEFTFHANMYWRIIPVGVIVIIILSFIFSYRLFVKINQEPVLSDTNESNQLPIISKDRIEKVLNYFVERENNSNRILNSVSPVVDPSL